LALAAIFVVLFLCFAPTVDLEPTALRAARAAQLLSIAIASAAFIFLGLLGTPSFSGFVSIASKSFQAPAYILDCELLR
jgi:hypothetical protein